MIYRYTLSHKRLAARQKSRSRTGSSAKPKARGIRKSRQPGLFGKLFRLAERVTVVILMIVVSGLLVWGGRLAMESDIFKLEEVHASGFDRLEETEVLKDLRPLTGTKLFDVDLALMEKRLLSRPWIKAVNLRKIYPNALSIHVFERYPVFLLMDGNQVAIVDETGAVIEVQPRTGDAGSKLLRAWKKLPVLEGVVIKSLQMGEASAQRGFKTALMLLREAPFTQYEGMELDVSQPEDIRVMRQGYLLRFGSEKFAEKWRRFVSVENQVKQYSKIKREIDLRFTQQVILRNKS